MPAKKPPSLDILKITDEKPRMWPNNALKRKTGQRKSNDLGRVGQKSFSLNLSGLKS
jgi:hypothetical protein